MASVALHAYDQIRDTGRVKLFRSHREGIAHGHQRRDFVAVEDVIDVLHYAAKAGSPIERGILNLGSGRARTFLDLTQSVFQAMGKPEQIDFIDTPYEIRDRYQYFTEARMERLLSLGWTKPFTPLETGVKSYIQTLARL